MSLRIVVQYLPVDAKVHCTAILLSQREMVFKILDHIYIYICLPYCTTGSRTFTVKDIPECATCFRIVELLNGHSALVI